jgi:hypothetical protein
MKERDELHRELIHSPTAAPAGNEAGGPRDRASATLGVKCRGPGVPTGHADLRAERHEGSHEPRFPVKTVHRVRNYGMAGGLERDQRDVKWGRDPGDVRYHDLGTCCSVTQGTCGSVTRGRVVT